MQAGVVVITTKEVVLEGYKVQRTIKGIDWKDVTCLVYNSCEDPDMTVILELSRAKNYVKNFIFISNSLNSIYYCIFQGLNADIYDDESYIMDTGILDFLVTNYKSTGMTVKGSSENLDILAKGVAAFASGNIENLQKLIDSPVLKKTLDNALVQVDNAVARADGIGTDVVEVFSELNTYVNNLLDKNAKTSAEIENLEKMLKTYENNPNFTAGMRLNSGVTYPTFTIPVQIQRVLYVKVYGHCSYLNSFLLAYQDYLTMVKQKKCKILMIQPKVELTMRKFKDVPRLARDSVSMMDFKSDFYITFEPIKMVMEAFFKQNAHVFIVVDYLGSKDPIVKGHMVRQLNAVASTSEVEVFNLNPKTVISALVGFKESMILPRIKGYAQANKTTKLQMYSSQYMDKYQRLDQLLDLN